MAICASKPENPVSQQSTAEARLGRDLVAILSSHCGERGDNEGAVETLKRIIIERNGALGDVVVLAAHCEKIASSAGYKHLADPSSPDNTPANRIRWVVNWLTTRLQDAEHSERAIADVLPEIRERRAGATKQIVGERPEETWKDVAEQQSRKMSDLAIACELAAENLILVEAHADDGAPIGRIRAVVNHLVTRLQDAGNLKCALDEADR